MAHAQGLAGEGTPGKPCTRSLEWVNPADDEALAAAVHALTFSHSNPAIKVCLSTLYPTVVLQMTPSPSCSGCPSVTRITRSSPAFH